MSAPVIVRVTDDSLFLASLALRLLRLMGAPEELIKDALGVTQ